ncbi:TIGR04222 domain-containing membrane protein [Streptomyces sp. G1]|uniref:TIGR04222 domain-containing membrane protein n=1 Tax=Streptomyces sp. G1 TaxID=361572 RepID=UPI00202F4D76|nr:TIGR04222 domain-containing membrane protein [Streptomyces sp. G1]MCM1964995.1 TIGR04222 domain-containing membrane protein [Streptomyces sp. G1]
MTRRGPMRTDPSIYELAHLAGGPQRVAEAALIALRDLGALTVTGPRVRATTPAPPARHPVEAVLTAFCSRGRGVPAAIAAVREAPETAEIGRRLRTLGLLPRFGHRPTRAGRRLLAEAKSAAAHPAYVFQGPSAIEDRLLRGLITGTRTPTVLDRLRPRPPALDRDINGNFGSGQDFSSFGGSGGSGDS